MDSCLHWHDWVVSEIAAPFAARIDDVRAALAEVVRERVVGPDGRERFERLMDEPGPRWFGDDRPVREVHADASMFVGGLRALLLQTLHPLAMAGVAQHSDYRSDPWGRLQRTADFLAVTTFGPAHAADEAVARVRRVHGHVRGVAGDGRAYSADDPHLLRWVHVAEVDSFLTAHDRFGLRPLDRAGRDGYVADMAVVARHLGVPAPPTSARGLTDQLRAFRRELRSTPESLDATRYLLLTPPLAGPARVAYLLIAAAAVATLPAWSRPLLRLPLLPITERLALRPLGSGVTRAFRWLTSADSPFQAQRETNES